MYTPEDPSETWQDLQPDDPVLSGPGSGRPGFWGTLGQVGKGVARAVTPPLLQDAYSMYKRARSGAPGLPTPQGPPPVNPDGTPAPEPLAAPPDAALPPEMAGGQQSPVPSSSPWQHYWQQPPMDSMAKGQIVTHPTVARLGESGPEAVIPLSPTPGAKLSPDLLGSAYSRYQRRH